MGLEADVFAGLSLGEYAALYACGAMRLTDAIKTVRQRYPYAEYCTSRTGGNGSSYSNGR